MSGQVQAAMTEAVADTVRPYAKSTKASTAASKAKAKAQTKAEAKSIAKAEPTKITSPPKPTKTWRYSYILDEETDESLIEGFESQAVGMVQFARCVPTRAGIAKPGLIVYELLGDKDGVGWSEGVDLAREFAQSKLGSHPHVFMAHTNCYADALEIIGHYVESGEFDDYIVVWPRGFRTAYVAFSLSHQGYLKSLDYWTASKRAELATALKSSPLNLLKSDGSYPDPSVYKTLPLSTLYHFGSTESFDDGFRPLPDMLDNLQLNVAMTLSHAGAEKPKPKDLRDELHDLYPHFAKCWWYRGSEFPCTVRQIKKFEGSFGYGEGYHIHLRELFGRLDTPRETWRRWTSLGDIAGKQFNEKVSVPRTVKSTV